MSLGKRAVLFLSAQRMNERRGKIMAQITMTHVAYDNMEDEWTYNPEMITGDYCEDVRGNLYMDLLGSASHEFCDKAMELFDKHSQVRMDGQVMPFSFALSNTNTPRETNYGDRVVFVYLP